MIVSLWIVKETDNYWTIIYFLNEVKKGVINKGIITLRLFFSFFVSPLF